MSPIQHPEVSVVIPVFNRPDLLREAVQSVLAQTYRNFELIVVDDGSTDETSAVLQALAAAADVRLLSIEHSGMPGAVRNRGAEIATGCYLAFLDSDDTWEPIKLERQLPLHRGATRTDRPPRISHTRERWLRRGRVVSQRSQKHRRSGDLFSDSLKKCIIGPSTTILERALFEELGGFREDLEVAEDYELWLRLCHRQEVAYLDEALTTKRAGAWEQLSERYGQIEVFRIAGLKALVESGYFADVPKHDAEAREELRRKCGIYAAGCRKRGRQVEARMYEGIAAGLQNGRPE